MTLEDMIKRRDAIKRWLEQDEWVLPQFRIPEEARKILAQELDRLDLILDERTCKECGDSFPGSQKIENDDRCPGCYENAAERDEERRYE